MLSSLFIARYIPQPPWFTSLLVGEVSTALLVGHWRCILSKRHKSACAPARYNPHTSSVPRGQTRELGAARTHPLFIPSHCRTLRT